MVEATSTNNSKPYSHTANAALLSTLDLSYKRPTGSMLLLHSGYRASPAECDDVA